MDEINNVVEQDVNDELTGSEYEESSERNYMKDGIAVGVGLLALDGAYHVGKTVYVKGIKPLCSKIKTWHENRKAQKEANKALATNSTQSVDQSAEAPAE